MKMMNFLLVLLMFPSIVYGASRTDSVVRVGMGRNNQAGSRMPSIPGSIVQAALEKNSASVAAKTDKETNSTDSGAVSNTSATSAAAVISAAVSTASSSCADIV